MTNNESLVCDQEHALLLQETGLMEGVEADGWISALYDLGGIKLNWIYYHEKEPTSYAHRLPTYRLDKILAKLSEFGVPDTNREASRLFELLMTFIRKGLLQQALCTAAKLLHLLFKEGLV